MQRRPDRALCRAPSGSLTNSVLRYDNNGNLKATVYGFNQPTGVSVDASGKVSNPAYTRVQAGAAFGGPIFYGHQAGSTFEEKPDHPNNVYWYQAKRANEVFQALDGKQREKALLGNPREELRAFWQAAIGIAPRWPGFLPERQQSRKFWKWSCLSLS